MQDTLIDTEDLGRLLKITPKTIRNKLSNGTWPLAPVRIGRSVRWRRSDAEQLMRGEIGQNGQRDSGVSAANDDT